VARVTDEEVRALVATSADLDTCDPFIRVAGNLVDTQLVGVITNTEILRDIELFLAAHFTTLVVERGALIRSSLGDSAETYQDLYNEGLGSTRFGQTAMILDTTGTLRAATMATLKGIFRVL